MVSPGTFEGAVTGNANVRPRGTTTLNGETAYVYEITADGVQSVYYVHTDTNLLRRVEMTAPEGDIAVEFHSWGDIGPIEPLDCAGAAGDGTAGSDGGDSADDAIDGPEFGDAIELEDEYAFEITAHYQDLEMSGRQHQDDHYHDVELSGTNVEDYYVDGTAYVVTAGVCVINPNASNDPTSDLDLVVTDPATHERAVSGNVTIKPTGTTTIDGETVYVYEVTADGVYTVYYVNAETSLLHRVEMRAPEGDIVVEFRSWGDVAPVEPPDECSDGGLVTTTGGDVVDALRRPWQALTTNVTTVFRFP